MLACARLGVIHSVVFGGFSGEACGLRAADSGSRVLIYMDGYYRSGKMIDHKAAARDRGRDRGEGRPDDRQGPRLAAVPRQVRLRRAHGQGTRLLRGRRPRELPRQARRPGPDGRGGPALPDVHERHDRQAQGLPAPDRRLPRLRHGDLEVHPGHPSGGRVLVHGRHRLDHRALVHRLRPARARGDVGHLRGRADLSRTRGGSGASPSGSTSTSSTRRRPRSACSARRAPRSRRSTTTASST